MATPDCILAQKTPKNSFSECNPFNKILIVVKAEEKVTEIPYKIITVTLNLLNIKAMQNNLYHLISDKEIYG